MGRRVLLVEDNVTQQTLMKVLAKRINIELKIVSTAQQALDALAAELFDLVLMDWQLPGMDGLECTRQIRQRDIEDQRHTPVIAVTAAEEDGNRKRCLQAGMDDFLSKPFSIDQFEQTIARYLTPPDTVPAEPLVQEGQSP